MATVNLSDDEAQKVMEFIEVMQKKDTNLESLRRLSGDTTFRLPSQGIGAFNLVEPI